MPSFAAHLLIPALLAVSPAGAAPTPSGELRITHLELDVTLDPDKGSLHETASVTVEGRGASQLVFALDEGLAVTSSRANAGVVEHRQGGDKLFVDVDPPLDGSRTFTFVIAGAPGRSSESRIESERAILAPSTPWYPRLPATWGTASVTVRVPSGWGAVAPGIPAPGMKPGVSRWASDRPVRSIAVAAAPGLRLAESTIVATPMRLATAGNAPSAKAVAARLAPAMAWLSGALAPYPFASFNVAILPGFGGRVDASGLAIIGRDAPLATDSDGADVLAGQWWGQAIGGDGSWVEAFAAWEACVFARDRGLPLPSDIVAMRRAYFELRSGDIALSQAKATSPPAVLRGKGSAAPDMIRLAAGDRATFDAMRELFAAAPGPALSLAGVRAAVERNAGRSLDRVFADWFDRAGAPQFSVTLRSFPAAGGGFRADVALTQKRAAYELPVEVVIYGPGAERRETVEVSGELTSVFYVVPFEPSRIEIDPLERIFRWK